MLCHIRDYLSASKEKMEWEEADRINKLFRNSLKKDKTKQILNTLKEDLDIRSKWMGLKALRKGYTPTPYHRKSQGGTHIEMYNRAEAAAAYLSTTQWGTNIEESEQQQTQPRTHKVITGEVNIKLDNISEEEMNRAIKKLKMRKCGGPDGTSIEMFKAMTEEPREVILNILNQWWTTENIDKHALRARVVHLFKKGNTSDLSNYRPISLLNTMYKIFTVIIQELSLIHI